MRASVEEIRPACRPDQRRDDQALTESATSRSPSRAATIRIVAWLMIVALAALQAWARRFSLSPDGMAYLDLSDAVVSGHFSGLVNLYWSPLYPALIGLARVALRPNVYWEFAVPHAVDLLAFVGTFAAFEYFLMPLRAAAGMWRRSPLASDLGLAAAYVIFGAFALTMTPLELTTPDLVVSAATLVVFGALLRARLGFGSTTRGGVALGLALGFGSLAKSFLVPWSIVCLVVFAIALERSSAGALERWSAGAEERWSGGALERRSRGNLAAVARATILWCVLVLPWTAVLSHRAHRLTFGDTGRLTFAWYVNNQSAPSLGGVPPGARRTDIDSILPGAGITANAPGTDPMWYDPARWNASIAPHWNARDERETIVALGVYYIQNLAPLLFAIVLVAVAAPGTRRTVWSRGWIVFVPVLAALGAYMLVLVTTRYIMALLLAGVLTLLAALPWPRRIRPTALLVGAAALAGIEALPHVSPAMLALVAAVLAGGLVAALVPMRRRAIWVIATLAAALLTRALLPPALPGVVQVGAAAVVLALWLVSRRAVRAGTPVRFATGVGSGIALVLITVLVLRVAVRLKSDVGAALHPTPFASENSSWAVAQDLASRGVTPGSGIAVIGRHDDAYWARAGRLHIVANVPGPRVAAFWSLSPAARETLLARFAAAGATAAVASAVPPGVIPDSGWVRTPSNGFVRPLSIRER